VQPTAELMGTVTVPLEYVPITGFLPQHSTCTRYATSRKSI
jgi:hypothetical protein